MLSLHRRSIIQALSPSSSRLLSAAVLSAVAGVAMLRCSTSNSTTIAQAATVSGQLRLSLSATSATGQSYRLRNATFTIRSTSSDFSTRISSTDDPGELSLELGLIPDQYEVMLESGYRLERLPASPGSGVLRAELTSSNPSQAAISANDFTNLQFAFLVSGEQIETGDGSLGISLVVAERSEGGETDGCTDGFEPNNSEGAATEIGDLAQQLVATLCTGDEDLYRFTPPFEAGAAFAVDVGFLHAQGDVEASLIDSQGNTVVSGNSADDNERLLAVSNGEAYLLVVTLFGEIVGEVTYTLSAALAQEVSKASCCEVNGPPGCTQPAIEQCVCALDSFCCEVSYDEACLELANTQCDTSACSPPTESDCCSTSSLPGCSVPEVESCLCAIDPLCCSAPFDQLCIQQAAAACGASCQPAVATNSCCQSSDGPGCATPAVESCVCELNPLCCVAGYDESCAALAISQCGATCVDGGI